MNPNINIELPKKGLAFGSPQLGNPQLGNLQLGGRAGATAR